MTQPEVTIDQGTLRGSTSTDLRGNTFYKFQGIPYAKPPLGELRFKAPVPPDPWSGILDATKEGEVSYHREPMKNWAASGSENCLFLNVYTKKLPDDNNKNLLPVMFWVHGGGLYFGSGNEFLYGPDFLITEDVVLVTFNYRLGLLGFVSFKDPTLQVPGNAGFKDQVMALKWVQKNISKFGGDPDNVTIFGESAGGISVQVLMLSPMTKGLFHKVIAQSGCTLSAGESQGAKLLAGAMGLEGAEDRTIYNTLMGKSVEEILQIQENMLKKSVPCKPRPLSYVVEKNSLNPFLEEDPVTLMTSGRFNQVPLMLGFTTAEGMLFELLPRRVDDFRVQVPWYFGYEYDDPKTQVVADKIKKFYFGDEDVSSKNVTKKYEMLSDSYFVYGIYVTTMIQYAVSKAPTFLYRVSVETELNILKKFLKIETPGVSHFDEVGYLFKNFRTPEIISGSPEDVSLRKFVKLWTNFAKFGNPTPDENDTLLQVRWKPVTNADLDFLDIGRDLVPMVNPYAERMNFWKKLFDESPAGQRGELKPLK